MKRTARADGYGETAREEGFLLLDAVTAVFVLSVGFFSAVYGMSVFLRSVDRLESSARAYIGQENARADAWFGQADEERAVGDTGIPIRETERIGRLR